MKNYTIFELFLYAFTSVGVTYGIFYKFWTQGPHDGLVTAFLILLPFFLGLTFRKKIIEWQKELLEESLAREVRLEKWLEEREEQLRNVLDFLDQNGMELEADEYRESFQLEEVK